MKRLLVLVLLIVSSALASAQKMSESEYHSFVSRLREHSEVWKAQISTLNIESLDVPYGLGTAIEKTQKSALKETSAEYHDGE